MSKVLVVLSGGQDSTSCLLLACRTYGTKNVSAVTFNYGQRHIRELEAARQVAFLCGVQDRHEICDVGSILAGTSPLTNTAEKLEQYSDFKSMDAIIGDRVEKTFVPMRNALFLTLAANRAVVQDCQIIMTGVCQADNANYPDCRRDFILAQEVAINQALGFDVLDEQYLCLSTPLMDLSKAESIKAVLEFGIESFATLAFSHTAYDGQYPPTGSDHATILRAHGFEEAGVPDPLIVRAYLEGAIQHYPSTANYAVYPDVWDEEEQRALVRAIQSQRATLQKAGFDLSLKTEHQAV